MTGRTKTRRNWGIALILSGALLAVVGWLGSDGMMKLHNQTVSKRGLEQYETRAAIADRWEHSLRTGLDALGELPFDVGELTPAGPKLRMPAAVDSFFETCLQEVRDELDEAFPGQRCIIRVRLDARPSNRTLSEWESTGGEVTEEMSLDPERFRMYGGRNPVFVIEPVYLVVKKMEGELYQRPATHRREPNNEAIAEFYFPESVVSHSTLDVAGNVRSTVVGVKAIARVYLMIEDTGMPDSGFRLLATILQRLSQLGLLLLIIAPPVWVFIDARQRRLPAALWGLFALLTSVLGALIYTLVTRESGPACPECGEKVGKRFVVCPYCQTELRGACPTCGQTVSLGWHYCPSCSTKL